MDSVQRVLCEGAGNFQQFSPYSPEDNRQASLKQDRTEWIGQLADKLERMYNQTTYDMELILKELSERDKSAEMTPQILLVSDELKHVM